MKDKTRRRIGYCGMAVANLGMWVSGALIGYNFGKPQSIEVIPRESKSAVMRVHNTLGSIVGDSLFVEDPNSTGKYISVGEYIGNKKTQAYFESQKRVWEEKDALIREMAEEKDQIQKSVEMYQK